MTAARARVHGSGNRNRAIVFHRARLTAAPIAICAKDKHTADETESVTERTAVGSLNCSPPSPPIENVNWVKCTRPASRRVFFNALGN